MHLFPKVKNPLSFHITRWHGLPWGIFRIMWMITFFPWDDSAALLKLSVQLFVLRTLQHSLGFYYLVDVDYRLLSLLAILHEVLQSVCNSQWGSVSSWCNRPVCWNKHCQRFLVNHVELWWIQVQSSMLFDINIHICKIGIAFYIKHIQKFVCGQLLMGFRVLYAQKKDGWCLQCIQQQVGPH